LIYQAFSASGRPRANDVEVGNRQFIVLDPDGYMLRFVQDLGNKKKEK
jgi:hypothetical protein